MTTTTTSSPPDSRAGGTDNNSRERAPRGGGGRGGGGGFGPARIDPEDRAQLAESPVRMARVLQLFRPHRGPLLTVTAIIVGTSVAGLASPFLLREIIDVALPRQDVELLVIMVSLMLAVTVITSLLGVLQTWIASTVGERVMHTLRTRVFEHLQRQSMSFFTRTRSGEVTSRLTNDIGGMQAVVTTTATSIATNVTTVIATAIAMIALSWQLSLFTLLVLPPAIWLTRRVATMRREMTLQQQRRMADLTNQIDEGLSVSGVLLTKTMGAGRASARRFADTSAELVDLALRSELAGRWRMATMSIIFAAIPALIYLVAGLPITGGRLSIGTLIAFATLQGSIFRPLMGLLNVAAQWIASMALFSRIFGYLDTETDVGEPNDPVSVDRTAIRGEVRIADVDYRYPGSETDAVADVDLTVPAGSSLALVGATGSGKSTLASMVARLRDPSRGTVTIDGHDLRTLSAETVADLVGVVTQETYLVHGTIADNLRIAAPDATDDQLWRSLEIAQIDDLVAALPRGLDTVVGARGQRFSGGEQQRLAIARVVLRDPPILVLDEATSALDNSTERRLQAALDSLSRGRTTITIAHRLSTIERADQIAVLDHGRVIELGTDGDLRRRAGSYARLAGATADDEQDRAGTA
ncbi:ABC transporter ATP-binding protein [Microlunatus soli]|uniref:ATP-binding cassette, subfamily B n=1 Tax=Microlunatus soli TaxID=630515 RepID=A0A1H1X1P1_9ACTN|nr:ABC transporter ATP-binding protein [Microlunatus soli]SDT03092.1 ATP-binding cassette, subfamily B [Microlunatus soli]